MAWLSRQEAAAMSEEDRLDYLTKTVLGEAVGEGLSGMLVVAQVIANRTMNARDFSSDPVAVAGQQYQFSTNNPFAYGGNQQMVMGYGKNTTEYQQARAAVQAAIIDRTAPDITGGSEYYHVTSMGYPASWPSRIKQYGFVDIGNHRIYPNRPITPGEIPANLARATEFGVASLLDVRSQGLKPIRPASLSTALRLQRETTRVAQARANAPETIRRSRAFAFGSTLDPFETGRPSNSDPIINRPEPAMKESMRTQLRATGTPNMTERTFALQNAQPFDGNGPILVSDALLSRPPSVVATPWGVRETVAAQVAAAAADNGRNQMVMSGNPNIAGSVVDWLYPQIEEGAGEANQEGKGDRAPTRPGQSTIERSPPARQTPGQSTIERGKPIVIVSSAGARVVPQSVIERDDVVTQSIKRANEASEPALATTLANQIATRRTAADVRTLRNANQAAQPAARNAVTAETTRAAADTRLLRDANANALPVVPGPNAAPKKQERLQTVAGLEFVDPPRNPPRLLPPIAPPRSNPIGIMPNFRELAQIPADPLRPAVHAPKPADTAARERARGNPLFGTPQAPATTAEVIPLPVKRPTTRAADQAPTPAGPSRRPPGVGPTTRPVATTRVTTTAPQPASVEDRVTARNTSGKLTVATASRAAAPATTRKTATPVAAQPAAPSPSSSGSGSGGSQAPTFVRASTGERLTPVVVSSYNADTNQFERVTRYR